MAVKYHRRVIRISATDSPNVSLALRQQELGLPITNTVVVPGVLTWEEYQERLVTWDIVRQTVGLKGEFYEGQEVKLFPEQWLAHSNALWIALNQRSRKPEAVGIDPGEGDADTAMAAGDFYGLIDLDVRKTPNTRDVQTNVIGYGMRHAVGSHNWVFDRGGGGLQHSDTLRAMGYSCTTIGFGEGINMDPRRGMTRIEEKIETKEERYAFVNRRAQMYGELSQLMDPNGAPRGDLEIAGYALPPASYGPQYAELLRQLSAIPRWYDKEGQLFLPPKTKKAGQKDTGREEVTMESLLGRSPDHADALVLMLHRVLHQKIPFEAGAAV